MISDRGHAAINALRCRRRATSLNARSGSRPPRPPRAAVARGSRAASTSKQPIRFISVRTASASRLRRPVDWRRRRWRRRRELNEINRRRPCTPVAARLVSRDQIMITEPVAPHSHAQFTPPRRPSAAMGVRT